MARTRRPPALSGRVAILTLCAAAGLAACSSDKDDRAAIAAAKCSLPVAEQAGFSKDSQHQNVGVEVKDLSGGRYRVTGRSSIVGEMTKAVDFVCEVEPDDSDRLRGFKVTRLEVTPIS